MPEDKQFNFQLCEERHLYIADHFKAVDSRIWAIIILLVANLGGVFAVAFKIFGAP